MKIEHPQRIYDLNGVRVSVKGDQQRIGFLDPILEPLLATDQGSCDWVVELVAVNRSSRLPKRRAFFGAERFRRTSTRSVRRVEDVALSLFRPISI